MSDQTIADNKYVELTYKVIDQRSGAVLTQVEFPLGYVHGVNQILAPPRSWPAPEFSLAELTHSKYNR